MKKGKETRKGPPEINPYVFTVLLFLLGSWCVYDGWITTDPEMQEPQALQSGDRRGISPLVGL